MLPRAGGKCPAMARDENFPTLAGELKVLGDSHGRQHCFPGPRGDRMYHLRTRDKSIAFSPETLSGGEKSTHVSNHSGTGLSSTVARSCKPRGNARAVASAARELLGHVLAMASRPSRGHSGVGQSCLTCLTWASLHDASPNHLAFRGVLFPLASPCLS